VPTWYDTREDKNMDKTTVVAAGVAAAAFAALMLSGPEPSLDETGPKPLVCTEDMACWDCTTMGNENCGTVKP
jgi:hypothetical protein